MAFPLTSVERIQHLQQSVQSKSVRLLSVSLFASLLHTGCSGTAVTPLPFFLHFCKLHKLISYRRLEDDTVNCKHLEDATACCPCGQKKTVMDTLAHTQCFLDSPPSSLLQPPSAGREPLCCREMMWCPVPILWEQPSERGRGEGWIKTVKKFSVFSGLHSSTSVNPCS